MNIIISFLFSLTVFLIPSISLAQYDLRDCPVGLLVFVDPWAGDEFQVKRVATNYTYRCDNAGFVNSPVDGDICSRYGSLILFGTVTNSRPYQQKNEDMIAVWNVMPAAPCCGWDWLSPDTSEAKQYLRGIKWQDVRKTELLGKLPFASIERRLNENELNAIACRK